MYLTQGKHREFNLGWNVATLNVNTFSRKKKLNYLKSEIVLLLYLRGRCHDAPTSQLQAEVTSVEKSVNSLAQLL